jgi:hypothetical protein
MNLLLRDTFLDYNMLEVFGKSLFQHEYKINKEAFQYDIPKENIVRGVAGFLWLGVQIIEEP